MQTILNYLRLCKGRHTKLNGFGGLLMITLYNKL